MLPNGAGSVASSAAGGVRVAAGLTLLAVVVLLVESWSLQPQLDDSYISYRYADNLMKGHGLVWNAGERVEAITNVFWVLWVAGLGALGLAAPVAGHILGVVSGLGLLGATTALAIAGVSQRERWIAGLAPWIVLSSPAVPYFATSGMETHGFLALTVGALAAHAHGRMGLATLLLCIAIGVRPDAGIFAVAILGTHALERGPLRRSTWYPALLFAAAIGALTTFRLLYYHSPVPNTFYAKVGGVPTEVALAAVGRFLVEAPGYLLVPAFLAARGGLRTLAPLGSAVLTMLYVVWSGGTAMAFSRPLSPLLPILAALAVRGAAMSVSRGERLAPLWLGCLVAAAAGYFMGSIALVAALCVGAGMAAIPTDRRGSATRAAAATLLVTVAVSALAPRPENFATRDERLTSRRAFDRDLFQSARGTLVRLRNNGVAADAWVGAVAIGVLGYYGEVRILDLLGLADSVIAKSSDEVHGAVVVGQGHLRSNAGYVMDRRPEVLLIGRTGTPDAPALVAVRALWEHPDLHRLYRWDPALGAYRLRPDARR